MIAVVDILPGHPYDRIPLQTQIPVRAHHGALGGLRGVDGAALLAAPQLEHGGAFAVLHGVEAVVCVVAVRLDPIRLAAEAFRPAVHVTQRLPPGNEKVGLALHLPTAGISKGHPGVLQQLGVDGPLGCLSGLRLRVEPGKQASVPVHGGVAHKLPNQLSQLVVLEQRLKLPVEQCAQPLVFRRVPHVGGGEGRGVELDMVGGGGGHQIKYNAPDEVEGGGGQAVGLHALPLLADVKVLVALHRVVEAQPGLKVHSPLVLPPYPAGVLV
ncbi:hypothetical protein SDC9_102447 [bioreactor metagenome]|uniref:Uncharacterized protein n=1 Tax=bioreactor metagenome TaxID=1076179 RepID=A0A645ARC3_9ZZZZ